LYARNTQGAVFLPQVLSVFRMMVPINKSYLRKHY